MQKGNLPNRKSIRLRGWDYRNHRLYFVTLCTDGRRHYFGQIEDGMMGLSVPGCVAWYYWRQIPRHQENVVLDEFVVIPDHIHGIIGIESAAETVGTCHGMSVPNASKAEDKAKFGQPQSKSLSMIINHFKGAITRWCNAYGHEYFAWQSRFYDHIARNEQALKRIRQYIFDNPLRWQHDQRNTDSNVINEQAVGYMVADD